MIIAVTGAHGFIGTHLCARLIHDEHIVAAVPREILGNIEALTLWFQECKPNMIYHLASYGNHHTQTDEDQTIVVNIVETYFILKALNDLDYSAFINVSSSSVTLPVQTFYSASKQAAEYVSHAFVSVYDKPIVTVRPYSVYGPGEADFRFIPKVMKAIKNDTQFPLDPTPVHDWIYVKDFIEGLLTVAAHAKELKGKIVDIGTGTQLTNENVVSMLEVMIGKTAHTTGYGHKRKYDTFKWRANTKLIKSLGWRPHYTLQRGLKELYDYSKQGS